MEGKMVKQNSFVFLVVLTLFFVGCGHHFPFGRESRIREKDIKKIEVGSTTKAEVYDLLGKPNFLENDTYCVYEVCGWPGDLDIIDTGIDFDSIIYRILLKFNENDRLINYEVERGAISDSYSDYYIHPKIAISPNGKTLAVLSRHDKAWLINLETKEKVELGKEYTIFTTPEFSPDSRKFLLIGNKYVKVIDVSNHSKAYLFKGHGKFSFWAWNPKRVTCLAFFPDGKKVATGGSRGFIKIWELSTGTEIITFKAHNGVVDSIEISPDGKIIATGSDATIRIWDSTTGTELYHMISETNVIIWGDRIKKQSLFKFSPDGKLFAVNRGTHVELWSIKQEKDDVGIYAQGIFKGLADVFLLPVFDETCLPKNPSLDFSKDGQILTASFGSIVVYDLVNRKSLWSYNVKSKCRSNQIKYAALHPNGKLLFIYTDKVGTDPNFDDLGISFVNLKQ